VSLLAFFVLGFCLLFVLACCCLSFSSSASSGVPVASGLLFVLRLAGGSGVRLCALRAECGAIVQRKSPKVGLLRHCHRTPPSRARAKRLPRNPRNFLRWTMLGSARRAFLRSGRAVVQRSRATKASVPAASHLLSSALAPAAPCRATNVRMFSGAKPELTEEQIALMTSEREHMDFDVLVVGAGPAGLSAAIRVKQLGLEKGQDLSVCVVEKGAEVGAHILSGNVFEPRALDELFPDWREMGGPDNGGPPVSTRVSEDHFLVLPNEEKSFEIPNVLLPGELHNEGNYIISLNLLVRWLGQKAEELGIEVYPGFSAAEVVYREVSAASASLIAPDTPSHCARPLNPARPCRRVFLIGLEGPARRARYRHSRQRYQQGRHPQGQLRAWL